MTGFLSALVLLASAAFLILTFRSLYAGPSRFNVIAGRSAMIFFAAMAAYSFWLTTRSRNALAGEFIEFPAPAIGIQQVTLRKPALLPGYRARLVMKEGRAPAPSDLLEKLQSCRWQVPGQDVRIPPAVHRFGWQWTLLDHPSSAPSLDLRYRVTEENRELLGRVMLEVTGSSDAISAAAEGMGISHALMGGFLCAMLFAAFGVLSQRRKQRAQDVAPTPPPPLSSE